MRFSNKCIDLVKTFEGCILKPYLDSVKIPTIGYGSTYYLDNVTKVTMNDLPITQEMANNLLNVKLESLAKSINHLITINLNSNQFDAILDLVYNIGLGNFRSSTLLKLINQENLKAAAEEILVWNKAGGKISKGLSRRRAAEKALFLS